MRFSEPVAPAGWPECGFDVLVMRSLLPASVPADTQSPTVALTSSSVRTTALTALSAAVLALSLAACGRAERAASPTAQTHGPQPTSVQQVCATQSWPRPVPQITGLDFDDAGTGSLACWDNLKAIAPDRHDVANTPGNNGPYRITDVSPAPGTPIGRNDSVTLHVVRIDLTAAPAFHPCDWVTADEAATILGDPSTSTVPTGDWSGSVEPFCTYNSGSHFVTSQLYLPASFPVDAQTELKMRMAGGHGSEASGLPGRAYCAITENEGKTSTTLSVLLSGNRLYKALGWKGESCDTLKRFAQTAIPRT
jgi:hypothetical protein